MEADVDYYVKHMRQRCPYCHAQGVDHRGIGTEGYGSRFLEFQQVVLCHKCKKHGFDCFRMIEIKEWKKGT